MKIPGKTDHPIPNKSARRSRSFSLLFPLTTSLLLCCHGLSTVRAKFFPCCCEGPHGSNSYQASCISWHNIFKATWQLKATLASSQSTGGKDTFSPDQLSPLTCKVKLSTLCSWKSDAERSSLSDHDTLSLSQVWIWREPRFHISPRSRDCLPLHPTS